MHGWRPVDDAENSLGSGAIEGVADKFDVARQCSPPWAGTAEGVVPLGLVSVEGS